jgi:putative ABC transport system permease protein
MAASMLSLRLNCRAQRADLRFALQSLWRHRMRSGLSMLGIVFGVLSVLVLIGIGEGAKRETLAQIERLGTRNILVRAADMAPEQLQAARVRGSRGLTSDDAERLRQLPGVVRIAELREVQAAIHGLRRERAPALFAVSADYADLQQLQVQVGRPLLPTDQSQRQLVCLLGGALAADLGRDGRPGGTLRIGHDICRVVGVLRRHDFGRNEGAPVAMRDFDQAVLLPLGADAAFSRGDTLSELILDMGDSDKVPGSVALVKRLLDIAHHGAADYVLVVPYELMRQASQTRRTFDLLLAGVALLSLLVGGVGIMNIMLVSVTERTQEIGLRRALGARRSDIARQFLTEAVLLTATGGLLGILLGSSVVLGVAHGAGWPAVVNVWTILPAFCLSLLTGLAFGAYPALRAARLDPILALRQG